MDYKKKTLLTLLSIFCVFGLSKGFLISGSSMLNASSFEAVLALILFRVLFEYSFKRYQKRMLWASIFVAIVISACIFSGAAFFNYHTFLAITVENICVFVSLSIVLCAIINCMYKMVDEIKQKPFIKINKSILPFNECGLFFFFFVSMLIAWLPAYLAVYPGIYSYDASLQLLQTMGGEGLNSHHPIIHTLILTACVKVGELIFHSYNVGIAIYSIVQACSLAAVFSYILINMLRFKVSKVVVVFMWLFYAFNPINQIFAYVTTKDVFFTVFFLLMIIFVSQSVLEDKFIEKKILYIICSVLMCLFRNQGVYVFIFFSLIWMILQREEWKKIAKISIAVIVVVEIVNGPLNSLLGVEKGSVREALSVPIQQLARVYNENFEAYTESELSTLYSVIPQKNWESYIPEISDPVKGGFDDAAFKEHKWDFFKIWVSKGIDNPKLYYESFLYGAYGYWYVDASPRWMTYIWFDGFFMEPQYNILGIVRQSKYAEYEEYLRQISYNVTFENIPIVSTLINQGFPFWVLIFVGGYIISSRKYKMLVPLSVFLGLWGTILLGPCICVRYAYPLMAGEIIMIMLLFAKDKGERNNG